ncbi:hypothetical protein D3C73_1190010 [compost metagenome]
MQQNSKAHRTSLHNRGRFLIRHLSNIDKINGQPVIRLQHPHAAVPFPVLLAHDGQPRGIIQSVRRYVSSAHLSIIRVIFRRHPPGFVPAPCFARQGPLAFAPSVNALMPEERIQIGLKRCAKIVFFRVDKQMSEAILSQVFSQMIIPGQMVRKMHGRLAVFPDQPFKRIPLSPPKPEQHGCFLIRRALAFTVR